MTKSKRNLIIVSRHKRWQRLWQFFFTGWGLIMIAALVATSLFTKQLLWSPITAINITDVVSNQFKMSGASFSGIDSNGEPFKINARSGYQEYNKSDIIFLEGVSGNVTQIQDGKKTVHKYSSKKGEFNRTNKTIKLIGNVRILSDTGNDIQTNELVIKI